VKAHYNTLEHRVLQLVSKMSLFTLAVCTPPSSLFPLWYTPDVTRSGTRQDSDGQDIYNFYHTSTYTRNDD